MYVNMIIMLSGFTANVYALQLLLIYALRLEYSLPSVFCRCWLDNRMGLGPEKLNASFLKFQTKNQTDVLVDLCTHTV